MVLTSAHILILFTLQLDLETSVQCSNVRLCLCFHQLLDKGSMVIFKIIISLTTGHQDRAPSPLLLRFLAGVTQPLLVEMQTCTTTLEICMVVSKKIGNKHTSGPSNTTLGHIPKGWSIRTFVQLCSVVGAAGCVPGTWLAFSKHCLAH